MGTVVFTVIICSCGGDLPAGKVPSVVHNTLKAKFPEAIDIDWKKSRDHYEAGFELHGVEYSAYVNPGGQLISFKHDIAPAEFPSVISEKINADYSGYKIDDAEIVERDSIIYYQAELESKGRRDLRLVFSADGQVTKQFNYLN